jgi:hypothetical protein
VYETGWYRANPAVDQLIANLESEFDLLRIQRYIADLDQTDECLLKELDALKSTRFEKPSSYSSSTQEELSLEGLSQEGLSQEELSQEGERSLKRRMRWWGVLGREGRIVWLKLRRGMLAEKRRRSMAIAQDIRFEIRLRGRRSL